MFYCALAAAHGFSRGVVTPGDSVLTIARSNRDENFITSLSTAQG
jgi:hypothetical protein